MAEGKNTIDDKIKGLLLPFILGGAGMGGYTGMVLKSSLDAEIDARRTLERKLDVMEERLLKRIERLEERWERKR